MSEDTSKVQEGFDWEKWGTRGSKLKSVQKMQDSPDLMNQSMGDITSYASTGAALGGPWGAATGAGVGVIKSALALSSSNKAEREARRAKQRQNRRIESLRKEELNYRKKELQAETEGRRYSRAQDLETSRQNSAQKMLDRMNTMVNNNADLRSNLVEKGYA